MVWEMAAMPDRPQLGHAVFHRRFNTRGVIKSCRPLTVSMAGSYDRPLLQSVPAVQLLAARSGHSPDLRTLEQYRHLHAAVTFREALPTTERPS